VKTLIPFSVAAKILMALYAIFFSFHLCILGGIVFFDFAPVEYLWGGKMQTKEQLLVFEIVSLGLQGIFWAFTAIHADYLKIPVLKTAA